MLARLAWMNIDPKVILDVGCGLAMQREPLQKCYPEAKIIALDNEPSMLEHAKQIQQSGTYLCAAGEQLPFHDQSVDFIFAHFLLPWQDEVQMLLREWQRILTSNGLLMISALGPETLRELECIVPYEKMIRRRDMHDLGDVLLQLGFESPVCDASFFTLTYRDQAKLIKELHQSGMILPDALAKQNMNHLQLNEDEVYELSFEVIIAHAFKAGSKKSNRQETSIPLSELRQQLKIKKEFA